MEVNIWPGNMVIMANLRLAQEVVSVYGACIFPRKDANSLGIEWSGWRTRLLWWTHCKLQRVEKFQATFGGGDNMEGSIVGDEKGHRIPPFIWGLMVLQCLCYHTQLPSKLKGEFGEISNFFQWSRERTQCSGLVEQLLFWLKEVDPYKYISGHRVSQV